MATINVTDTVVMSDIAGSPTDTIYMTESVAFSYPLLINVTDSTAVTDGGISIQRVFRLSVTDSTTVTDTAYPVKDRLTGEWGIDGTSASGHVSGSAPSVSHTITNNGAFLTVAITMSNNVAVYGCTYRGVAMTGYYGGFSPASNRFVTMYYAENLTAGSGTIAFSCNNPTWTSIIGNSYYGAALSGVMGASTSATNGGGGGTSITGTVTTTQDGSMLWGVVNATGGAITAGSNTQVRTVDTSNEGVTVENSSLARQTPVGSHSLGASYPNAYGGIAVYEFKPYPSAFPLSSGTVSDSTTVTDTPSITKVLLFSVADSTTMSDNTNYTVNAPSPYYDSLYGNLITSGYKWLTNTLYSAQQQHVTRPAFSCQIIDDTIQPTAILSGTGTPTGHGTMVTAPDGKVFAIGSDGLGGVVVKSSSTLHASAGVWSSSVTLATAGQYVNDSRNEYSITCSDYINGSYRLSAWFFSNFQDNGFYLNLLCFYSDDMGVTWNAYTVNTSIPNTSIGMQNLSVGAMKPILENGVIKMGCFYVNKNTAYTYASGFSGYDIRLVYGDVAGGMTLFQWYQNANSYDWTIHSLSAYYLNGRHYCVFSGFRNILDTPGANANYSVWVTSLLNIGATYDATLWSVPASTLPVGSSSPTNLNSFILPQASVIDNHVYLIVQATEHPHRL
jgi:hypothetical protein